MLGTAILLSPFLYLCAFAHPSGDDFGNVRWTNWLQFQKDAYSNWTGRYFSSAIISLNPIHWHSLVGYRIALAALLLAFTIAFALLITRIISSFSSVGRRTRTLLVCAALLLLFNNFISMNEGFYWYCGAITYTLPLLLMAGFLHFTLQLNEENFRRNTLKIYLVSSLLLAAIIGSNETILPVTCCVSIALFFFYKMRKRAALSRYYSFLILVCFLASAVAILAPGNFVRQSITQLNLLTAFPAWLSWSFSFFKGCILDPYLLSFSLLTLMATKSTRFKEKLLPLLPFFLLPGIIVLITTFPSFWSMGSQPPYRALNVAYTLFLLAWIALLLRLSFSLQLFYRKYPKKTATLNTILCTCFVALIFSQTNEHAIRNSNFFIASKVLANRTQQEFDAFLTQRYQNVKNSLRDTIYLPPIPQKRGNILFFSDLNTDPKKFPNPDFAAWLGKAFVARIPDSLMTTERHK